MENKNSLKVIRVSHQNTFSIYSYNITCGEQVICVNRKLTLMQWKHSAAWTAWCPASDTDTVEGFMYLRVNINYYSNHYRHRSIKLLFHGMFFFFFLSLRVNFVFIRFCYSVPEWYNGTRVFSCQNV